MAQKRHGQRLDKAQGVAMTKDEQEAMLTFGKIYGTAIQAFQDLFPDWQVWCEGTIISPTGDKFMFDGRPPPAGKIS